MAAPSETSILAWILMTVLIGGLPVWLVWQYVKAARSPRRDEPRDRLNWLRVSHPNHPDLPAPARQALWMPTPRGRSAGRALIYAIQAAAVVWLTWNIVSSVDPRVDQEAAKGLGFAPVLAMIVVAFATSVLTNLWTWAYEQLQGLPFRVGRGVRALRRAVAPHRAIQRHDSEADCSFGPRRLGSEAPEGRPHLRIGE